MTSERASTGHRRKWTVAALGVAAVVVLGTAGIVVTYQGFGGAHFARPKLTPPAQTLLAASMARQPVVGWTVGVATLGLPDGSTIASSVDAVYSDPLVGAVDDRAFFLARSPGPGPGESQWWLAGVSTDSGRVLFPPARLGVTGSAPMCMLNGPSMVLCLVDDVRDSVLVGGAAWVVDAHTGAMRFVGPTPVAVGGEYRVGRVGTYAVAISARRGVYGIGPSAELTWFVPGEGALPTDYTDDGIVEPLKRTHQHAGDRRGRSEEEVIFSVVDGSTITLMRNAHGAFGTAIYAGGVALITSTVDHGSEVVFFDDRGQRLASTKVEGTFASRLPGLPVLETASGAVVFSSRGDELATIPGYDADNAFLVGTTLYTEDASTPESAWRPVDLATGKMDGSVCHERLDGFFASDGSVGVFKQNIPNVGLVVKAVDLGRCEDRWSRTAPVGSFGDIWRANAALVALSDDATELTSLVAS